MTILVCQKRHHKPHYVLPVGVWAGRFDYCDGTPRWPYARPKPPRIDSDEYSDYQRENNTICARFGTTIWVIRWFDGRWTHAAIEDQNEASKCAQGLVNERKKCESATGS